MYLSKALKKASKKQLLNYANYLDCDISKKSIRDIRSELIRFLVDYPPMTEKVYQIHIDILES